MITTSSTFDAELLELLGTAESAVAQLRQKLLLLDGLETDPEVADRDIGVQETLRRQAQFLKSFTDKKGELTAAEASTAAVAAGYKPQGSAGFSSGGEAALRAEGGQRVITQAGLTWLNKNRHLLDDVDSKTAAELRQLRFLRRFPKLVVRSASARRAERPLQLATTREARPASTSRKPRSRSLSVKGAAGA